MRSGDAVPREVLVPAMPPDAEAVSTWLSGLRGSTVALRVPQRGDKRALLETLRRNAAHALALHKTRRGSDLTTRSQALQEIQDALGLDEAPLRIECYDVSHLQESDVVASMVVFEDGLARKSEYRRFVIRGAHRSPGREGPGATSPRSTRSSADGSGGWSRSAHAPASSPARTARPGRTTASVPTYPRASTRRRAGRASSPTPPNLVVVDGGAPQVAAAQRALDELGIDDVALCGLAKRLEEVWLPGDPHPVVLPRSSEGLYLLQRVRDEAHRFAIALHRTRRSKSMTASALDGVPGLGETRRTALLKHFGSLKRLAAASVDEVMEVPGVGRRTAEAVVSGLAARGRVPAAVNTATGEILDVGAGVDDGEGT